MGKQGGDLKWWAHSSSSTVLLDPAAFVESWKRRIQGKDGIPAEHQRLIFAYRVATQEGLSYTCKRSNKCPKAKERAASDFLRELRNWKALLKSDNHVIAKLLHPLVAAEDEEIASHLYCETARELRDIGIPCNVYYLFFDKWLLAARNESDKCCKMPSNLCIQIDKDFQSKRFEIFLFGRLNGSNLPLPFVYRMNGGEVAAQMSMHEQTAKYRQGHQMRRLGLSTQSVEKGVEGRDFNAPVEMNRSLNDSNGSEQHDNQYIRCGKGLELTAIVTKDPPPQFNCIVLAVIQLPPVNPPRRQDQGAQHIPTFPQVSDWRRGGNKAGLQPDIAGFSLSSCNATSHRCEMVSHESEKSILDPLPVTACTVDEHFAAPGDLSGHNASPTPEVSESSRSPLTKDDTGDGGIGEMASGPIDTSLEKSENVDETPAKITKKKKKRKGRRGGRNTVEGNAVCTQGIEPLVAGTVGSLPFNTDSSAGEKVNGEDPDTFSELSLDQVRSDYKFSHFVQDVKESDRQDCGSGKRGEPCEVSCPLSPCGCRADGFDLGSCLRDGGLSASIGHCPDGALEVASKQIGRSFRNEPKERRESHSHGMEVGGKVPANAEFLSSVGKDAAGPLRPKVECAMSPEFRDPCAPNASPNHSYMSTSNSFSHKLSISHPCEHIIDVIDLMSTDGGLQDSFTTDRSVCSSEGPHFPLRELAGNLGSLTDSKEQLSHSDTKPSARGGYSSSAASGRGGRSGAEGSGNRGYGRGSDERRGPSGYHGGSGQGSSGSSEGTGPGSSGSGGGGSGSDGGNGNRGGGGDNTGGGWDARTAENDSGNGSKEGDSDERRRQSLQAGNGGEVTGEFLQRKKSTSSLDTRVARKVTIGNGEQVLSGSSSSHGTLTTSGGGKENNHTFWQKVQKSIEGEEITDLEQLTESIVTPNNHCRTASDEVVPNHRADSKAHPSTMHLNGVSFHGRTSHGDLDCSERGTSSQESFGNAVKPSSSDWVLASADLSSSSLSRRPQTSLTAHGPDSTKGAWQRKISWDENRQTPQKNVTEVPVHTGPSKGQLFVKQLNVRSARTGTYIKGQVPDQQIISHTRSLSAPSTPHVFEESFPDSGEINHSKPIKHVQPVGQHSAVSGSGGQTEQVIAQTSVRPQSNYVTLVGLLGDVRAGSDELSQKLTSWKGRKPNGEQERSMQREKVGSDRERPMHCAQKWVPVEPKTGGTSKGFSGPVKATGNTAAALQADTSSRDFKESNGDIESCKQNRTNEEDSKADGIPCSSSPSKSVRWLQTFLTGSKKSSSGEQVSEPRDSPIANEPGTHAELANLRGLLPREKIADISVPVSRPEGGSLLNSVVQKVESTKVSVFGERRSSVKKETARRDLSGPVAVRSEPSPADKEKRRAIDAVLDAVRVSCRDRRASEGLASVVGSPLAEFEKVLGAVAPSFTPVSGPSRDQRVVQENDITCTGGFDGVLREEEACFSEAHQDNISDSRCSYGDTLLSSIWQWYEEHSYYGVEVTDLDSPRGSRDGGEQEQFIAYFVPYLSGLQLFGYSSQSESTRNSSVCGGTGLKPEASPSCQPISFSANDVLATLFPTPGRVDESTNYQRPECTAAEHAVGPCNEGSAKDAYNQDAHLLYEFFDADQPQVRQPLFPKVKDLMRGVNSLNSHSFGDPTILDNVRLGDLHPASWFAVAWYPIYRISEGPLRAVFLTYHSLNHFTPTDSLSCPTGGACDDTVSMPVVGLECYNLQAEPWLLMRPQFRDASKNLDTPPVNAAQCLDDRIRSLKGVAALMARGIPYEVTSRSSDGSCNSSGSASKFKHSDYEFFLKRRR